MKPRKGVRKVLQNYVEWIQALRRNPGSTPPLPPADDQVAALAHALEELSVSLRQKEEETRRLFAIVAAVEDKLFVTDVLDRIYDGFKGLIPFERIGCALVSPDGHYVTAIWSRSELGPVHIPTGFSQPLAGSSLEALEDPAKPRIINDLEAYLEAHPESQSTRLIVAEGGRSNLTCPLTSHGKRLGFIFFTSNRKNTYESIHQDTFKRLAGQISAVIHFSSQYQSLFNANLILNQRQKRLEAAVATDPLTKIANRNGITAYLDVILKQRDYGFAFIMADIDHFKRVNDQYGHSVGDQVLTEFAQRLKAGIRSQDMAGRFGGEEFVVILQETDATMMRAVAERLRQSMEKTPFKVDELEIPVTASFGAAYFAPGSPFTASQDSVVRKSDELLYLAKNGGRNRVVGAEF